MERLADGVRKAIVQMSLGNERVKQNLASIFGILFFGVPHRGMDIEPFLRMAGDQPNRQLVEALAPGSAYLEQLDAQFRSAFRFPDSNIVSFYETRFTRVAKVCHSRCSLCSPSPPDMSQTRSLPPASGPLMGLLLSSLRKTRR